MSTLEATDHLHLARAIDLAEGGRGATSPNPLVGAVIVRDGVVLGEGFHAELGGPHAERAALASVEDARGATMYVSLEPCAHTGRTPPCTEAIIEAGISRVVIASDDPTEKASGRGPGILRDEGIEVVFADGDVASRARRLNQPFRKHARTGRPWILFKSAMTLDGKVATRTGDSKWISGEDSRRLSHHWRAEVDAVVVGIGTALTDDPQLTSRIEGVKRQPRRIVFDSEARLPLDSQLVKGAAEVPLTVVVTRAAHRTAVDALEVAGAEIITATGANEPDRVRNALVQLGRARDHGDPARGRPASGRRVPGRGRGGRDPPVPRAGRARWVLRARPAGRRGRRAHRRRRAGAVAGLRAGGRRRPDHRAHAGVVGVFTGLVADLGTVAAIDAGDEGVRLSVRTALAPEISEGDSVAVNGVCLTATNIADGAFSADVMNESLRRTSLGAVAEGGTVNLELPLRAADRLGGHFVQGHVDGVATVRDTREDGFARVVTFAAPPELLRYIVEKGSIAVDGVSLTVSAVDEESFAVSLIPETLERTTLGTAEPGRPVNLEVDVLAKYVEKLAR